MDERLTKYRITEATKGDIDRIMAMALDFASSTKYGALFPINEGRLREVVTMILDGLGTVLLAEAVEDGGIQAAGMLALVVMPHPFSDTMYAEELAWWIAPAFRKGRLGIKLLDAAETWAAGNKSVSMVKLSAPTDDVGRFLKRRGYDAIETHWIKRVTG